MSPLPSRGAAAHLDLQERIRAAELAVIRRDARVRGLAHAVGSHAQRLSSPVHWLSVAGGVVTTFVGRFLSSEKRRSGTDGGMKWPQLLSLLWPLLPKPLRRRFIPAALALGMQLVLPLLSHWRARRRGHAAEA